MSIKRQSAFTLLELVLTIGIFIGLIIVCSRIIPSFISGFQHQCDQESCQSHIDNFIDQLDADLSCAFFPYDQQPSLMYNPVDQTISLHKIENKQRMKITYSYIDKQRIVRKVENLSSANSPSKLRIFQINSQLTLSFYFPSHPFSISENSLTTLQTDTVSFNQIQEKWIINENFESPQSTFPTYIEMSVLPYNQHQRASAHRIILLNQESSF